MYSGEDMKFLFKEINGQVVLYNRKLNIPNVVLEEAFATVFARPRDGKQSFFLEALVISDTSPVGIVYYINTRRRSHKIECSIDKLVR